MVIGCPFDFVATIDMQTDPTKATKLVLRRAASRSEWLRFCFVFSLARPVFDRSEAFCGRPFVKKKKKQKWLAKSHCSP